MAVATSDSAGGAPFVKFLEPGDTLIGALASDPGKSKRQRLNYDSKKPMVKEDGKPLLEEIIHLIVMPGTTAKLGSEENGYEVPEPLTHVRYSVAGFKWGQVIQARKALESFQTFRKGQSVSGDVYMVRFIGWSAETANPDGARQAGFTVSPDGKRIVLRSMDEKDRYVLAQSRRGGNTNPAKDFEILVRRTGEGEKEFEQAADTLFLTKPWELTGGSEDAPAEDEYNQPASSAPSWAQPAAQAPPSAPPSAPSDPWATPAPQGAQQPNVTSPRAPMEDPWATPQPAAAGREEPGF